MPYEIKYEKAKKADVSKLTIVRRGSNSQKTIKQHSSQEKKKLKMKMSRRMKDEQFARILHDSLYGSSLTNNRRMLNIA